MNLQGLPMSEPLSITVPIPDGVDAEFRALSICLYALTHNTDPFEDLTPAAKARIVNYLSQRFPLKPAGDQS